MKLPERKPAAAAALTRTPACTCSPLACASFASPALLALLEFRRPVAKGRLRAWMCMDLCFGISIHVEEMDLAPPASTHVPACQELIPDDSYHMDIVEVGEVQAYSA